MPRKNALSSEDLVRINTFNNSVCGQMRRNKTGKDFNIVLFLDYKGDPCHSKMKSHTLFLKARPSPKGFSIYNPVKNDKVKLQHDEFVNQATPTCETKTIGPSRDYKIVRKKVSKA